MASRAGYSIGFYTGQFVISMNLDGIFVELDEVDAKIEVYQVFESLRLF